MAALEHKTSGCAGCNAAAHEEAEHARENEERETQSLTAGMAVAAGLAGLLAVGLWGGAMLLLSHMVG
ncbi:hypothetical protein ACH4YO_19050 [Streptomyces noursei]|uniref:hypothetical protein n=1 Tax=Streptomyces noursei TaxID=1971 RepID=UPI0033D74BD0